MRRLAILLASLALPVGVLLPSPVQAALPVSYSFLTGAVAQGADPSPNAPGSNIWTCRPSAAHPRPVVLVHGTAGAQDTNWATYAPLLKNNGYCVFALTYGATGDNPYVGGVGRMQDSAKQLAAFITKVRRATGAAKVDIIGHSQGTLMPNYYAKFMGGGKYIKRYISLASLWHGTDLAVPIRELAGVFGVAEDDVPGCTACAQFAPGSAFMTRMRSGGVAVDGIDYTNIVTKYDQLVVPYTSGIEPGMRNIVIQDKCDQDYSDHLQIAATKTAARVVLNRLDPAHAKPVPCSLVLPVGIL